eukprot:270443-Rhodomonas_salina.2
MKLSAYSGDRRVSTTLCRPATESFEITAVLFLVRALSCGHKCRSPCGSRRSRCAPWWSTSRYARAASEAAAFNSATRPFPFCRSVSPTSDATWRGSRVCASLLRWPSAWSLSPFSSPGLLLRDLLFQCGWPLPACIHVPAFVPCKAGFVDVEGTKLCADPLEAVPAGLVTGSS